MTYIPLHFLLLVFMIVLNYYFGIAAGKTVTRKRLYLSLIIIINISILVIFKYFDFLIFNFNYLFVPGSSTGGSNLLHILVPVGISYQIFRAISYNLDIYNGTQNAETNFFLFSLSFVFFPILVAGPIERMKTLLPQFKKDLSFDADMATDGLKLIVWGFFKKLVIADRIALYVNFIFTNSSNNSGKTLLLAVFLYTFQIYADFSGYTDIARGISKVLGFDIMENFRRPYFAVSVADFWRRWHISLSNWLRDYVFLPNAVSVAGKFTLMNLSRKKTELYSYIIATCLSFFICGLWHGASWTFILWGVLHGLYISFGRITLPLRKKIKKSLGLSASRFGKFISIIFTFIFVSLAWVLFRADSVAGAFDIYRKIFSLKGKLFLSDGLDGTALAYAFIAVIALLAIELRDEYFPDFAGKFMDKTFVKQLSYILLIIIILLLGLFDGGQFIYFKF